MKVSIIVPAYNARTTIGRVIEACLDIDYPDKELIIVDDGSTDGTADIASRYPVKVLRLSNGGPAKARNEGWKASKGDVCYFTDSDCLPRTDVLEILMKHFKDKNVGAVGGTYEIANSQFLLPRLIHAEIVSRHRKMPVQVDFLGSYNCAYKKNVLEESGGFNEEYSSPSAEDNDLSYRILKINKKMSFDARAAVAHFHEKSVWKYLAQQFNHGKWRVKLYLDHKDKRSGDNYAGLFDFIQPALAILLIVELPLFFFKPANKLYLGMLALYTLMQMPRPLEIAVKTGRLENILLAPVTFLRGVARGLGFAVGLLKFGL